MALSELQRAEVQRRLGSFCEARVPAAARGQVRMGFRVTGSSVVLFEERPAFHPPHDWQELPIAKFTYVGTRKVWRLYCQHRDLRWHSYELLREAASFKKLIEEVAADPTEIFWG